MFRLSIVYLVLAAVLFIVEVCIAVFVDDNFVRPYGGDVLVVILMYCVVRAFTRYEATQVAWAVLMFSFFIEFLQYFRIVKLLGLQHSELANVVLGNSFAWLDLLAYVAGFLIILVAEQLAYNSIIRKKIAA